MQYCHLRYVLFLFDIHSPSINNNRRVWKSEEKKELQLMAMEEQGKLEAQHRGSVILHLQCLSGCRFGPSFLLIRISVSQQKGGTLLEQGAALPSVTAVSAVHLKVVGLP